MGAGIRPEREEAVGPTRLPLQSCVALSSFPILTWLTKAEIRCMQVVGPPCSWEQGKPMEAEPRGKISNSHQIKVGRATKKLAAELLCRSAIQRSWG